MEQNSLKKSLFEYFKKTLYEPLKQRRKMKPLNVNTEPSILKNEEEKHFGFSDTNVQFDNGYGVGKFSK